MDLKLDTRHSFVIIHVYSELERRQWFIYQDTSLKSLHDPTLKLKRQSHTNSMWNISINGFPIDPKLHTTCYFMTIHVYSVFERRRWLNYREMSLKQVHQCCLDNVRLCLPAYRRVNTLMFE